MGWQDIGDLLCCHLLGEPVEYGRGKTACSVPTCCSDPKSCPMRQHGVSRDLLLREPITAQTEHGGGVRGRGRRTTSGQGAFGGHESSEVSPGTQSRAQRIQVETHTHRPGFRQSWEAGNGSVWRLLTTAFRGPRVPLLRLNLAVPLYQLVVTRNLIHTFP